LGIEINAARTDMLAVLAPLNHPPTAACVEAERGMSRALAGSCTVPLGAYAECHGDEIEMTGFVASIDGTKMVKEKVRGSAQQAENLGQLLAEKLVALGANEILASLETH
jgi:hydroxymethylbilane synthase